MFNKLVLKRILILMVLFILLMSNSIFASELIKKIEITGYTKPKAGQTVEENLSNIKVVNDEMYEYINIYWTKLIEPMREEEKFEKDNFYTLCIELRTKDEYKVDDYTSSVLINGKSQKDYSLYIYDDEIEIRFDSVWLSYLIEEIFVEVFPVLAVIIIALVFMYIINKKVVERQKDSIPKKVEKIVELSDESKNKLDKLVQIVKERTKTISYKISCEEGQDIDIYSSKLGGIPYWDLSMEYPTDSKGNKIPLLAQINFEKEQFEDDRLPKEGILQFFIATDDLNGADFNEPDNQKDWRVIYHKEIKTEVDKEKIIALEIPISTSLNIQNDEYFPFYEEYILEFKKVESVITTSMCDFEDTVEKVLKEEFDEDVEDGKGFYERFTKEEYRYLLESFESFGHKLLGYPDFTQNDPRWKENLKYYDALLLQIDSEGNIMWGDSGVANFFINSKDLESKDFSKILYNWDCY